MHMGIGISGWGIVGQSNAVDAGAFLALESYLVENAPGFFVGDNSETMQEVRRFTLSLLHLNLDTSCD